MSSNGILRGDSELASTALKLARHVRTEGLRRGSGEQGGQVLKLMKFTESACESPLFCPADMHSDRNFQDPRQYADSLVLLARDVDAHPWGVFGCVHPAKYLPFLQQLAGDLMDTGRSGDGDESQREDQKEDKETE
jgi:hypothetical protein